MLLCHYKQKKQNFKISCKSIFLKTPIIVCMYVQKQHLWWWLSHISVHACPLLFSVIKNEQKNNKKGYQGCLPDKLVDMCQITANNRIFGYLATSANEETVHCVCSSLVFDISVRWIMESKSSLFFKEVKDENDCLLGWKTTSQFYKFRSNSLSMSSSSVNQIDCNRKILSQIGDSRKCDISTK